MSRDMSEPVSISYCFIKLPSAQTESTLLLVITLVTSHVTATSFSSLAIALLAGHVTTVYLLSSNEYKHPTSG